MQVSRWILALLSGVGLACHATPVFEATRTASILDEATGQPIPNVYFVVQESHRSPGLGHGSVHQCVRAAATISTGTQAQLRLPASSIPLVNRPGGESGESKFAYTPGHCILPGWKTEGSATTFRARRNTDAPEQRIRHISQVLLRLPHGCGSRDAKDFASTREAIVAALKAEAQSVATTPYERHLASQAGTLSIGAAASTPPSLVGRGFAIVDAAQPARPINWNTINTTCKHCSRIEAQTFGVPAGPPPPSQYKVVCREPTACDLDRRGGQGTTYLWELIEDADAPKVAVLLAAGADPEIPSYPGGPTGLDAMLGAATQWGSPQLDRAIATLGLLLADGRVTVRDRSRQAWLALAQNTQAPEAKARRSQIAALLQQLKERPAFTPACPADPR